MKTLMSMGVLFAIIFLILSLRNALAEKENLTIQANTIMPNNTTMPNGAATNFTTNVIIQNVSSTMNVMDAIKARRSIRAYQDRPVEEEKLHEVLEAGRLAPSAHNLQDRKFIVVRDKEKRQSLSVAAMEQPSVAQAPIVIAACGTDTENILPSGQHTYPIDAAIAIDQMSLEAVEQGLGTCWIGAFHEDQVKQILRIPNNIRVVVMLTLGYPAESPSPRPRKILEEIVAYDGWQD